MKIHITYVYLIYSLFITAQQNKVAEFDLKVIYTMDYIANAGSVAPGSEKMVLFAALNGNSTFLNQKLMVVDSIQRLRSFELQDVKLTGGAHKFYLKKEQFSIKHYENWGNELFQFQHHVKLDWQLTTEKKKIDNYNCIKALVNFGGRNWIAWYAIDISTSSGPYKFGGLPGLILEIKDTENLFSFKAINVSYGKFFLNDKITDFFTHEKRDEIITLTENDFLKNRINFYKMSFDERLRYMNRYSDGMPKIQARSLQGASVNTNRPPKEKNFIERSK